MMGKVLEFKRVKKAITNEHKPVKISIKDLFCKALPQSQDVFNDWVKCWQQYNSSKERKFEIFALINTVRMQEDYDYSLGTEIGHADFIINNNTVTIFDI